ncbi:MAG TPA: glutamine amidotransferase [Polyangia bacterium]|nr:glutamine amidotransferase [Polyangia bacterium]
MTPMTYDEWRVVSLAPWGHVGEVAAVVCACVIVFFAWRALRHDERASRRWILLALRLGAVAAALVLFFEPAVRLQNVTRLPNHVALLVDASESMRLAEKAGEPNRAARVARWLGAEKATLERLSREHIVDVYTFGSELSPSTIEAVRATPPARAEATHLREALANLRARYEGRDLGGVVVFSDGVDNGRLGAALGDKGLDVESTDFLRSLDTPIHAAWVGQRGLNDVAIARVLADDFAFVRTSVTIEAVVRVVGRGPSGAWDGKTLPVTLRRDGVPVKVAEVTVEPGVTDYKVAFQFTPERVGKYLYEITTPLLDGEAIVENNARAFLLKVIRDKIRVLQVTGRPSWDVRYLRGQLKHDPNVDLVAFFILRTPTDLELVPSEELSLIPFPTEELFQEQLRSFDLVFLQNFNYGPYGIGAYLGEIRRYVEEGGGLAMLGGDLSFTSGGWAGTPVADILPVELLPDGTPPEKLIDPQPFKLQLTADGRAHPLTALKLDVQQNRARWAELPELNGVNLVARAKPGATVLGVHPTRKDLDGKPLPVLTVGEAGKGRVLTFGSDDSWRWGFADKAGDERGRAYQRFWDAAIRWLIKDPALSFLRVETDQPEYARGQKVQVTVRALGTDYQPLKGATLDVAVARIPTVLDVATTARPEPVAAQHGVTDEDGELTFELPPQQAGGYRITARATLAGRPAEEDEVFLVRGAGKELEEPEARDDLLRAVAATTGGSFRGPGESLDGLSFWPPRVVRVNAHRDVEVWSRWWMLAVAVGCLALNWALRRRWGYA